MPTTEWLKKEFDYGYDSGNVTDWFPNKVRRAEEKKIGGSYRRVFNLAIKPHLKPDSQVMELGPGNGAWSRAILSQVTEGGLTAVDYQDVAQWLHPEWYDGRLQCHQVTDNSFDCIEDETIDFFWSMGVLCHNNQNQIFEILRNSLAKMKPGAVSCHQYSDWEKLSEYGWERGGVPTEFQELNDDEIWWPRNSKSEMQEIAESAGWKVLSPDLNLVQRDSMILLQKASD